MAFSLLAMTGVIFVMEACRLHETYIEVYRHFAMYIGSVIIIVSKREVRDYTRQLMTCAVESSRVKSTTLLTFMRGSRVSPFNEGGETKIDTAVDRLVQCSAC